jgi:spermidine/putrescine transport system substrate-binding protein
MKADKTKIHSASEPALPRRTILKLGAGLAAGAATTLTVGRVGAAQSYKGKTLSMLSWPGHGDPYMVGPFEEKYGCKVKVKEYVGGDQLLAIVNSTPPGTYDVILADAEVVEQLISANQIVQLEPGDYPFDQYWPQFQRFESHWQDGKLYAVMLRFGYLGIAYNAKLLSPKDVETYKILWDPKVTGKVGWFDWYLPSMGVLSLYLGNRPPYDVSNADFDKLKKTLFSLKPQTGGYFQMADLFSSLSNEQAWLVPGIGDWVALLLEDQGHPIKAVVPNEGGLQWTESLSIARGAQNPDLAREYIRYATSPEGQIRTATLKSYAAAIPNIEGWKLLAQRMPNWSDRLRLHLDARNVMDEYKEGKIFIRKLPKQQSIEEWNEAWTKFKST